MVLKFVGYRDDTEQQDRSGAGSLAGRCENTRYTGNTRSGDCEIELTHLLPPNGQQGN
jgi:hypothetical protein